MQKWIEVSGKTEEAAISAALAQLGMDRDEVSVEILDRAKQGFFGLGSTPARVRVSYQAPDEAEKVPAAPETLTETHINGDRRGAASRRRKEKEVRPNSGKERVQAPPAAAENVSAQPENEGTDCREEQISAFLTGLMNHMKVDAAPRISESSEGSYQVVLEGEGLGALIGRRGETLDAIQQLTNYAVNRGQAKRVRVHIDAEQYRAKREESLQRLAHKVAGKVVKYRRNVTLEPMNAYERHVIHAALQDYPDVVTYSMGTEPNRRTVVAYSRGEHKY